MCIRVDVSCQYKITRSVKWTPHHIPSLPIRSHTLTNTYLCLVYSLCGLHKISAVLFPINIYFIPTYFRATAVFEYISKIVKMIYQSCIYIYKYGICSIQRQTVSTTALTSKTHKLSYIIWQTTGWNSKKSQYRSNTLELFYIKIEQRGTFNRAFLPFFLLSIYIYTREDVSEPWCVFWSHIQI